MSQGQVFVVSAPSGAGKTSLVAALLQHDPRLVLSVSHTTRPSRAGEKEGKDYFFVQKSEFDSLIDQEKMLEYASVYGELYGTSAEKVHETLVQGHDIILEIDWQGAEQIRQVMPEAISIFIMPPSPEVLQQRLSDRQSDDESAIAKRMAEASDEIAQAPLFDYIVLNDNFDEALAALQAIIVAARQESSMQISYLSEILEKFAKKR